jgi:hypothetical protein
VYRVLAHEGVGGLDSEFGGAALVIGVHQVELNLACHVTERVAGLDRLEYLDAAAVVAVLDRRLRLIVRFLQVLHGIVGLFIAGTGGQHGKRREQNHLTRLPLQALEGSRQVEEIDHIYAGRTKSASIP